MTTKRTDTEQATEPTPFEQELIDLKAEYERRLAEVEQWRKAKLEKGIEQGYRKADLARLTGYSDEAIRHFLNPELRAQHNRRRAKKKVS